MTADREALEKLREPFPEGTVGVLPKPYRKDSPKGNCQTCGGYHGLPAAHLDFVGHAAVTDRLLSVDPEWAWAPFAKDERGLPALDREGNLWINLTICGVTRPGVGDGPTMKEKIGDAIRNAAMRFGVALALWTKDELESGAHEAKAVDGHPDQPTPERSAQPAAPPPGVLTAKQAYARLCEAFQRSGLEEGSAAEAAKAAWGDRGAQRISEEDLGVLIQSLDLSYDYGNEPL